MKIINWLTINNRGSVRLTKNKPSLNWNEISMKLQMVIPNELFSRPLIEARLEIKDVLPNVFNPELIVNTKELIEQQTGAKIDFTVVYEEKVEEKKEKETYI